MILYRNSHRFLFSPVFYFQVKAGVLALANLMEGMEGHTAGAMGVARKRFSAKFSKDRKLSPWKLFQSIRNPFVYIIILQIGINMH